MPRTVPDESIVVCGRNPVVEALRARPREVDKVFVQRGVSGDVVDEILHLAAAASVPVQRVPAVRLNALAGKVRHQGVAAVGSAIAYSTLEDLMARIQAAGSPRARILYLDRVTDPRNLGAVLRSAAAFGVSGLIVPASESAPLNTAALKASAGAAVSIPVVRVGNPVDTLDGMREMGYWIIGADGSAPRPFSETDWSRPVVIALGSEDRGLAADILGICDEVVSIPMAEGFDSLNVSVAAAILMCAAFRAQAE